MKKRISIRSIILGIVLIITIFFCYQVLFGNFSSIREKINSMSQLKQNASKLENDSKRLERITLEDQKKQIARAIKTYQDTKKEYNQLVETISAEELKRIEESDVYDVGFLWTIIGNYATEEGVDLQFKARANNVAEAKASTKSYASCNLQFIVTGDYINLTDFIYDLEDDDRLAFEINNFKMIRNDNTTPEVGKLKVTLKVREINLYKDNLTEDGLYWANTSTTSEIVDDETEDDDDNNGNGQPNQNPGNTGSGQSGQDTGNKKSTTN